MNRRYVSLVFWFVIGVMPELPGCTVNPAVRPSSEGGVATPAPAFPLGVAPGERYLVDRDGRPFLLLGDSAWDLFVSVTEGEAEEYLDDRRRKGFSALLVELIESKYSPRAPCNIHGDAPFTATLPGTTTPDFSTPNEAYFAHVDRIVALAARKGLLLEITPAYLGYRGGDQGWYQQMKANGAARLAAFGAYVGHRYQRFPNILWVEGGDTDSTRLDQSGTRIDPAYTRAIAMAIKAVDRVHLHTVHGQAGNSPRDAWAGEPWLDVSTIYTYPRMINFVTVQAQARAERARTPSRPFFLIESTYEAEEDFPATPALVRQQAYQALLDGGMGENFGNGIVWRFTRRRWWWPFGSDWRKALDSQGSKDMARLAALFSPRRWETLIPDQGHLFLTAGYGSGATYVSAAADMAGKLAILYVPAGAVDPLTVDLTKMNGRLTARWYDPTSGRFSAATDIPSAGAGARTFVPPGRNDSGDGDWVLVFEAS